MLGNRTNDQWIAQYSSRHQHPVNRICHSFGIPMIAIYLRGPWQLTQYYIAEEHPVPPDPHHRLSRVRSRDGTVLAVTCRRFFDDLSMEGTGRTWDGRLLNWDARVHGRACFTFANLVDFSGLILSTGYYCLRECCLGYSYCFSDQSISYLR